MVVVILIVAIGTCQLSGTSHAVFTFLAFFHGHSLTILHLSSLSASSMEISGRGFLITFMSSIWKLLLCAIDLTPVILGTIRERGFFIFGEFLTPYYCLMSFFISSLMYSDIVTELRFAFVSTCLRISSLSRSFNVVVLGSTDVLMFFLLSWSSICCFCSC